MTDQTGGTTKNGNDGGSNSGGGGDVTKNADGTVKTPEQIAAEAVKAAGNTDGKKEGEGKEGDGGKDKDGKADKSEFHGAPEKYEAPTMPEGMTLDQAKFDEFQPVARKLGLSQAGMQELVNFYSQTVTGTQTANKEAWDSTVSGWEQAGKDDKEIGGANYEQSKADAKAFIEKFGTPALQEYMDVYKVGSHPEIIRAFAKAGRLTKDDKTINPGGSGGGEKVLTPEEVGASLYPSMQKKE